MSAAEGLNTGDEFSSVFDTTTTCSYVDSRGCFSPRFSRSVGDLQQISQDINRYDKRKRNLSDKDINTFASEKITEKVKKWADSPSSTWKESFESSSDCMNINNCVPLSPSSYRLVTKQKSIETNIDLLPKPISRLPVKQVFSIPSLKFNSKSDSFSKKNETSEEVSQIASGTLDEYSNSVFIEDEDPTNASHMSDSEFEENDNWIIDENTAPNRFNAKNFSNFGPGGKNMVDKRLSLGIATRAASTSVVSESVTFNPLFNSTKAQSFIEERKQSWKIPLNDEVSHENPLFRNAVLHYKLMKDKKEWTTIDMPKPKRRFFRGPSFTDLLQSRTLKGNLRQDPM
mmetsp:Transcript_11389/g.19464  ORF Transcript_11389/g.19464 Transcript_11389/m.19464 type:complete len:343 (-) Transcript_11389:198-1226(-)